MAPKKREKENASKRFEQVHADHEHFLQAFEKPTQIYKFLKSRSKFSPLFLNRNLTYMPKRRRMKSSHHFNIDSLLQRIEEKKNNGIASTMNGGSAHITASPGYLNITYYAYEDKAKQIANDYAPVRVETILTKIWHKKRKEASCPMVSIPFKVVNVPTNPPKDPLTIPTKTTISIPTEMFQLSSGHTIRSTHILVKVISTHANGYIHKDIPPTKKRKLSVEEEDDMVIANCNGVSATGLPYNYCTNLTVYDKFNRCLLPEADYQVVVHKLAANCTNPKLNHMSPTWETIPIKEDEEAHLSGFEKFKEGPLLQFRVRWTQEAGPETIEQVPCNGEYNGIHKEDKLEISRTRNRSDDVNQLGYKLKVVYQFLYNDNSRQQTEASEDLHCPWCSLDCYTLYSLLKHLKLCHSRFTFNYVPAPFGARIDVAINEQYDGSFCGGPTRDSSNGTVGYAFSRTGPVRRTTVSNILVCHPKRPRRPSLSEFLNEVEENETFDSQRSYVSGHNRLYHHTSTCLPIHPKEMEMDSEDESDPKWLRKKTQMMIDDFTDVNDGEKELMKMWNLHVMKYGYVGDCQIPLACAMFLEHRGKELLEKNLYRNFVLHVCNLFDFGLVSPVSVYTTVQRLQELIGNRTDVSKILHEAWTAQRKRWLSGDKSLKQRPLLPSFADKVQSKKT